MEKKRLLVIYENKGQKDGWKNDIDKAFIFGMWCSELNSYCCSLLLQCKMLFWYGLLHVSRRKAKVKKRTSIWKMWIIYLKGFPKPHGGVMACPSNSRKKKKVGKEKKKKVGIVCVWRWHPICVCVCRYVWGVHPLKYCTFASSSSLPTNFPDFRTPTIMSTITMSILFMLFYFSINIYSISEN